jgi:hypothetical protein
MEMKSEDLHAGGRNDQNSTGFDGLEEGEEAILGVVERQIWLSNDQEDHQLLADVHDGSIFYNDFPPLPDFPCMSSSSSSSSSSIPAPVKAMIMCSSSSSSASSTSSAASWAVLRSDAEEDVEKKNNHYNHDSVDAPPQPQPAASMEISQPPDNNGFEDMDCMDLMETFGYMDLVENNDFFDPSCIFQLNHENPLEDNYQQQEQEHALNLQEHEQLLLQSNNNEEIIHDHEETKDDQPDDMATVFLEWLRTNKESVSAEDLRSVRIKKATIECAAKRLGGGKEAMKQLLKLVLEWVQNNHLHKRRSKEALTNFHIPNQYYQDLLQNPNPNPNLNSNSNITSESSLNPCFTPQSPWIPQPPPQPYMSEPTAVVPPAAAAYPSMVGYMGDPYTNGHSPLYPAAAAEYHMQLDSSQSWPSSQFALVSHYNTFPDNNIHPAAPQAFASYGNHHQYPYQQYFNGHGERLVRLGSSATKEARKKRMARQRRFLSHHRHHHNQHQNQNNTDHHQHARLGNDNCTTAPVPAQPNPGNWMYWPASAATVGAPSASPVIPVEVALGHPADRTAMQPQNVPGRVAPDRRQVG